MRTAIALILSRQRQRSRQAISSLYSNPQLRPKQDDIQLRDNAMDFYLPAPLIIKRYEGF